jgi:hypothetical protein
VLAPENQKIVAPPADQAEQERRVQQRQLSRFSVSPAVSSMTMENTMVVAPTTAVPINTGLAVALKVLPAPSFSSSRNLAELESSRSKPKSRLISCLDAGYLFYHRQFIHRLSVVGDRAVAVDGNRYRTHPQKAEGDQPERKNRGHHGGLGVIRIDDRRQSCCDRR